MDIFKSLRSALHPLHREGWPFVVAFALGTLLLFLFWAPLGWIGAVLTVWCVYFFRDPERVTPARPDLVIAPADGLIVATAARQAPLELGLGPDLRHCVSIFMSVFDVHVNRSPIDAEVMAIVYSPGVFLNAASDKASDKNERNALRLRLNDGREMGVVQIAGLIARRIVCDVAVGARLGAGQRFGIIRFGSRVDVYLPVGVTPLVAIGQRTIAGETVLADFQSGEILQPGEVL